MAPYASGQTYSYDDGSTENALSIDGLVEIGFLHGFDAGVGGDLIQEIHVGIGTALAAAGGLDGNDLRLCIWEDPNQDGNPLDAVRVYESAALTVTQSNTDTKVVYPIVPNVPVTGLYFVGVGTSSPAGAFPVGLDITGYQAGELAYIFGNTASIDTANLFANSTVPFQQTNAVFLLDAIGGGSTGLGMPFCDPMDVNSTGLSTTLTASPEPAAGALVHLEVTNGPPLQFGYVLVGTGYDSTGIVVGNGRMCLSILANATIGRYNFTGEVRDSIGQFDANGVLQNLVGTSGIGSGFDIPLLLPYPGNPLITVGETHFFQAWHREAGGESNFSNGLSLTF